MDDWESGGDKPAWAVRLRAERLARGWSQSDAVRALRTHAGDRAVGQESLVRQWKRWEAGEVEPGHFHKRLIAKTFGTVTAAVFPPIDHERESDLIAATGMGTLEIITRMRMSDVSQATIEALQITAERLACEYSHTPSDQLHVEGQSWLRRLLTLLDRRLTLAQHREVLALAGNVSLLVGCLEYDMGQRQPAEATRQAALSLGLEAGEGNVVGWAHEMRAWYALTQGHYRAAIAAADAGLAAASPTHSVVVQLAAHRAKAWARMGDRRQVELSLDRGRDLLEALPYPDNVDNHFVVDPSKWDFYTMDCYRLVGDDQLAETYAREVLRTAVDHDGRVRRPMRAAEAFITLGVVATRNHDLEQAVAQGRRALAQDRKSLPSLTMFTGELVRELQNHFPDEPAVRDYIREIQAAVSA